MQDINERIERNPRFKELTSKRNAFSGILSILMLVIYFGFIALVAFNKAWLATPLSPGSVTTIGIPVGIAVIVSAFILTGIYVRRANSEFDELTQKILEETK